jgi:energy-coupling factor transport system ATP-binding protein
MGLSKEEIDERVHTAAAFTGVTEDMLSMSPFELSGGQKRRAAIAGVLAMRPEVLILDEPTAGLDPRGRKEILTQIFAYQKETHGAVLLVSHSMEEVAKYSDRVLVLDKGRVFSFDTTDDTFKRAEDLMRLGLTVPGVTRIFSGLRKKGISVPEDVFTMVRAKEELLRVFERCDARPDSL